MRLFETPSLGISDSHVSIGSGDYRCVTFHSPGPVLSESVYLLLSGPATSPTYDCDTTFFSVTNMLKLQNLGQIPTTLAVPAFPQFFLTLPFKVILSCYKIVQRY